MKGTQGANGTERENRQAGSAAAGSREPLPWAQGAAGGQQAHSASTAHRGRDSPGAL